MVKADEMDDLRDGAIQTITATMDDAEEQHEQQISQVSKRGSSEQIADLHERAQRARQLEGQEGRRPSTQSMVTAQSNDSEDLPPLEEINIERMTVEATAKKYVRDLVNRQSKDVAKKVASSFVKQVTEKKAKEFEERRGQTRDISSAFPQRPPRTSNKTTDYPTDMNHWNQKANVEEKDLLFQLHLRGEQWNINNESK